MDAKYWQSYLDKMSSEETILKTTIEQIVSDWTHANQELSNKQVLILAKIQVILQLLKDIGNLV